MRISWLPLMTISLNSMLTRQKHLESLYLLLRGLLFMDTRMKMMMECIPLPKMLKNT